MINSPIINKLAMEYATRMTQEDIANGRLMDFSRMDINQMNKQLDASYLHVIEKYIKSCNINGDFNTLEHELEEYANDYINKTFPFMDLETIGSIITSNYSQTFVELLAPKLQSFILYVELLRNLHFYLDKKYIKKINSEELKLINNFISYSLELLVGIDTLLLSEKHNSVVAIYRTFYENFIVFSYLQKHKNLITPYLKHIKVDEYKLKRTRSELYNEAIPVELEAEYKKLIEDYGPSFSKNYGWANISNSSDEYINLKSMYEDLQLDKEYKYYYQLSCKYTHSTLFSLNIKPTFDDLIIFLNAIIKMNTQQFEILFEQIKFKFPKEEHLIPIWVKIISNDVLNRLKS